MSLKRIWVDFNSPTDNSRIRLTTRGSVESLTKTPVAIGERVVLTDDDIQVEAVTEDGDVYLVALPDWDTQKDV